MSFWSSIHDWFSSLLDQVKNWLTPAAEYLVQNGGLVLLNAAAQAVAAVAADPGVLSDTQKRDKAGQLILASMQAQGIQVAISAVNLAIEAALADYKKKQALPPSA